MIILFFFTFTIRLEYNWGYKTDPAKGACLGLNDGVCNWPKGKALGGTSVVNFMIYQRGHRRDFDGWAANGNVGWSYDEILPYFKRSERIGIPELYDSPFHGRDGYLDVQRAGFQSKIVSSFLNAAKEFGYPVNDPNGESQLGFSRTQATTRNGRRWSAAKAFLRPAQHRPNLFISMNSRVTKILIDPETKITYGVEFVKGRRKYRIQARKEVILSAGPIVSVRSLFENFLCNFVGLMSKNEWFLCVQLQPQLLMLSGIGPSEHLREFDIPVIQDLRVGFNLQDHNVVNGLDFVVDHPISISEQNLRKPSYMLDYFLRGSGPFTIRKLCHSHILP